MNQGEIQVNEAAFQISSWGAPAQTALNPPASQQSPQPVANDSADLSAAAVTLIQGRDSFDVNAKVVQASSEMTKQSISLLA
jgi:hypothetical protein